VATSSAETAPSIRIHSWRAGRVFDSTNGDDLARLIGTRGARTWIDLTDPGPDLTRTVGQALGLHPLVAEDIVESNERAKVQLVGNVIHIVTFVLRRPRAAVTAPGAAAGPGPHRGHVPEVEAHEVDFVLGPGFLLSVHPANWDPMKAHQLRMGIGPLLERGPDFVLWAMVDAIVDGYFPVFDRLGDEIDEVQDAAIERPVPDTLEHVFRLKRELIRIRHVLAPSREVFAQLTSREFALISEPNVFYFRDVYDHLIRLNDELDAFRELVAGALEIYLSTINNNLSTIMKRLTGVTVILAGIGAIAGLFGMSEAASAIEGIEGAGFYVIVTAVILGAIAAVLVLRRINWL
jgi:magnesium transporter